MAALRQQIRRTVIEQSKRAGAGHTGFVLSIYDILAALFGTVLTWDPDDADRDRSILSNGQTSLEPNAALSCQGLVSEEELDSFCAEGIALGAHPQDQVRGIDFSAGPLGHGPELAAGWAAAASVQRSERHTFALMSDAELNEGPVSTSAVIRRTPSTSSPEVAAPVPPVGLVAATAFELIVHSVVTGHPKIGA